MRLSWKRETKNVQQMSLGFLSLMSGTSSGLLPPSFYCLLVTISSHLRFIFFLLKKQSLPATFQGGQEVKGKWVKSHSKASPGLPLPDGAQPAKTPAEMKPPLLHKVAHSATGGPDWPRAPGPQAHTASLHIPIGHHDDLQMHAEDAHESHMTAPYSFRTVPPFLWPLCPGPPAAPHIPVSKYFSLLATHLWLY